MAEASSGKRGCPFTITISGAGSSATACRVPVISISTSARISGSTYSCPWMFFTVLPDPSRTLENRAVCLTSEPGTNFPNTTVSSLAARITGPLNVRL